MRQILHPKRVREISIELKVVVIGLLVFAGILLPLLWLNSRSRIDLNDIEGVKPQHAFARLTRVTITPPGRRTLIGRPTVYVRISNQEIAAGGVSEEVYANARIGLPVDVEYRVGRSGRVYVSRVELRREIEPQLQGSR